MEVFPIRSTAGTAVRQTLGGVSKDDLEDRTAMSRTARCATLIDPFYR